jgi:alcohol dehydrogenase, propanol-preferring
VLPLDRSTVPESVIDRIGSVDNPMSQRRASGTLAKDRMEEASMASIEQKRPGPRAATETMRAAVVEDFARPLVVKQVAKPVAGQGEIVVRVETSGLCHTDIHAAHGDWPVKPSPPFIPGHEGIGVVQELGSGVTEVAVGDRVAMPWLGYACGSCDYCVSGWETLCLEQKNTGYSVDGGFAEYVKAFGRYVVRVPDGVNLVDAAPLTCAGVTTYKAIKVAGTRPSDLAAVFGVGGLGHLALQYARIAGGRVVAVDLHDEKLELAKELGAEFTVNAAREDPVAAIQQLGGADQAIALAVSPKAFEQAFGSLRRGGTLVFVALPADNTVELPIFETVLNGITVVGSIVGTRVDLREVFELHAAGKTKVITEVRPLDTINESIADVEAGRIPARIVFTP